MQKFTSELVITLLVTIALLCFATLNFRGLKKTDKQDLLAQDCDRYDLDIVGLQEVSNTEGQLIGNDEGKSCIVRTQVMVPSTLHEFRSPAEDLQGY